MRDEVMRDEEMRDEVMSDEVMNHEVMGCVEKMSRKSMRFYYGISACFVVFFAIIVACGAESEYIIGIAAVCGVAILIIILMALVSRKNGREDIEILFRNLNPEQQASLVEKIRQMPKGQWKTGYFITPEITFFMNLRGVHGVRTSQILWVYKKIDIMFPLFKYSTLVIHTTRHEKFLCEIGFSPVWAGEKQEDLIASAIRQLRKYFPGIISGYSRDLYRLFSNNIGEMKKLYAERESSW